MLFRRILDPPADTRSWVAWVLAAGLTLILFLTIGLPAGTARVSTFAAGAAPQPEPSRQEDLTFQTLPRPASDTRRAVPATPSRTAPEARPAERRPARASPPEPVRPRATPDSVGGAAAHRAPVSVPTQLMSPATPLELPGSSLPTTPAPTSGANAAPTCSAPCVAGVRAGVSMPQHTLTAAERDSVLQAISSSVPAEAAASGGGGSQKTGGMGGISIPIGLPGGGPSRAQRKRDSTINAHTLPILARLKQRADSVLAARRRDSLEAIARQQREQQQRDSISATLRDSTSGARRQP